MTLACRLAFSVGFSARAAAPMGQFLSSLGHRLDRDSVRFLGFGFGVWGLGLGVSCEGLGFRV